jgi:endonuclease/exonuclease/phosphatase family metal-dependent hydrolase
LPYAAAGPGAYGSFPIDPEPTALKVATFNVRKAYVMPWLGEWNAAKREAIVDELQGADIVGLNEVGAIQAYEIADSLGMYCRWGSAPDYVIGLGRIPLAGNAVLSTYPISDSHNEPLPWVTWAEVAKEERHVLRARIQTPTSPVEFFVTHLESQGEALRNSQAMEVADYVTRFSRSRPVITVGDFNSGPPPASEGAYYIMADSFRPVSWDFHYGNTHPAWAPSKQSSKQFDHIFVPKPPGSPTPLDAWTFASGMPLYPGVPVIVDGNGVSHYGYISDHLAVAASLQVTPSAAEQPLHAESIHLHLSDVVERVVSVSSRFAEVTFRALWPGSDVRLTLIRPDGVEINASTDDPRIYHAEDSTYEMFRIDYPMSGDWTMRAEALEMPPEGEFVTLRASATETLDLDPPVSAIEATGQEGTEGWYTSDVTITVSATDDEGGSGLANTTYSLDDSATWSPYNEPFPVAAEGTTTVLARSTDNAANTEEPPASATVKIDKTPPVISAVVPTGDHVSGEPFDFSCAADDSISGVDDISATLNVDTVLPGTISLDHLGVNTLTMTATDVAGNSATQTYNFNVGYRVQWQPPIRYLDTAESYEYTMVDGSTLPVKWLLKDYYGNIVTDSSLTVKVYSWQNPANCVVFVPGTGSSQIHYDPTTGQYIVNLHTKDYEWLVPSATDVYQIELWGGGANNGYLGSLLDPVQIQIVETGKAKGGR